MVPDLQAGNCIQMLFFSRKIWPDYKTTLRTIFALYVFRGDLSLDCQCQIFITVAETLKLMDNIVRFFYKNSKELA